MRKSVLRSLLCLSLLALPLATWAEVRQYANSRYVDEAGFSVFAEATQTDGNSLNVHVSLQWGMDYAANDEIVRYDLVINDARTVPVPAVMSAGAAAPTDFAATVALTETELFSLRAVPVWAKFGQDLNGSLLLEPNDDDFFANIGGLAAVRNPKPNQRLNLRNAPSEAAEVYMQYYNGVPLEITNILPGGWVAVGVGGARGYMRSDYIAFGAEAGRVTVRTPTQQLSAACPLYSFPLAEAPTFAQLPKHTKVTILGQSTTWWHVQADTATGYVPIGGDAPQAATAPGRGRTYTVSKKLDDGCTVNATATEQSVGQYTLDIRLAYPQEGLLNDVVTGYLVYLNGWFEGVAWPPEVTEAAPTRFVYTFQADQITELRLIPRWEKEPENIDASAWIDFAL